MILQFNDLLPNENTKRRNSVFISFYFLAHEESADAIKKSFEAHISPILNDHSNEDSPALFEFYLDKLPPYEEFYYSFFQTPNAKDAFVIQVGLNSRSPVETSWPGMRSRLAELLIGWYSTLDPAVFMGYTMVYKADAPARMVTSDTTLSNDFSGLIKPLLTTSTIRTLTRDSYAGGILFLMDLEADLIGNIYCVIGNGDHVKEGGAERYNQIVPKVIYQDNAFLQFTEKIYHKAMFLKRQVKTDDVTGFISTLTKKSGEILQKLGNEKYLPASADINYLSLHYNEMLLVHQDLSEKSFSAAQQEVNFEQYKLFNNRIEEFDSNILEFLYYNVSSVKKHLDFLVKKSDLAIDEIKTTLGFIKLREETRHTSALQKYQHYLAVIGIILATLQVIDNDSVKTLLTDYDVCLAENGNIVLLTKLTLATVIVSVILLIYYLVWRLPRKKDLEDDHLT